MTMDEAIHRTLAAEIASLKSEIDWHCEEIDRLRAENEKLREALKPLAMTAYGIYDHMPDDGIVDGVITVGQCRQARAILEAARKP